MIRNTLLLLSYIFTFSAIADGGRKKIDPAWVNRPEVKEIRDLVHGIDDEIKTGKLKTKKKTFDWETETCEVYPDKEREIVQDETQRVRRFSIKHAISQGETEILDRYYDSRGILRFAFDDVLGDQYRVYFDRNGKEFLKVETEGNVSFEITDKDDHQYLSDLGTSQRAKKDFSKSQKKCPST